MPYTERVGHCFFLVFKLPHILIVTIADDFHALAVQAEIQRGGQAECDIVEWNHLGGVGAMRWNERSAGSIRCHSGRMISLDAVDVIWWRRTNSPQSLCSSVDNAISADLIQRDCQAALMGLFTTSFVGKWISEPTATSRAENKLLQLQVAKSLGFNVPKTLVSNDPDSVREFCDSVGGAMVVKSIRGTPLAHLAVRQVRSNDLNDEASIRSAPAIYQELIEGNQHLRVTCFGDSAHSVLITSDSVDWRANLDIPFEHHDLDNELKDRILRCLSVMNLRMGIFDLKIRPNGTPVWFEINPQGQFLFCEGLSGAPLLKECAAFLIRESKIKSQHL